MDKVEVPLRHRKLVPKAEVKIFNRNDATALNVTLQFTKDLSSIAKVMKALLGFADHWL